MKLPILNTISGIKDEVEIGFALIEDGSGTQAVHDAVVAYNAAQRSGTACAKTVGEVSGTNKNLGDKKALVALVRAQLSHHFGRAEV